MGSFSQETVCTWRLNAIEDAALRRVLEGAAADGNAEAVALLQLRQAGGETAPALAATPVAPLPPQPREPTARMIAEAARIQGLVAMHEGADTEP